jgi:hypothetical protein
MSSLAHYYGRAKSGLAGINPVEATDLAENWMIAGATGAALALMSTSLSGGLDAKIGAFPIPLDGLVAMGLGVAGLSMHSKELKVASIAAGGAASARVFAGIFKRGLGTHGDIDEGTYALGMGWGAEGEHDRLVEAARYL